LAKNFQVYLKIFRFIKYFQSWLKILAQLEKNRVIMDDYKISTNEGIEHISAWNLEDYILNF